MTAAGVGGQIQGISLDAFLQMAQMDKTTCTLTVKAGSRNGRIFVLKGELIDAETTGIEAAEAACQIISWPHVLIEIENTCLKKENRINQPLMNILMEAMRIRDEQSLQTPEMPPAAQVEPQPEAEPKALADSEGFKDLSQPAEKVDKAPRQAPAVAAPAPKRPKRSPVAMILAGGLVLVLVAGLAVWQLGFFQDKGKKAYETAVVEADALEDWQAKQQRLERFLAAYSEGPYAQAARDKLDELRREAVQLELEDSLGKVDELPRDPAFEEKAMAIYNAFLARHPEGPEAGQVKQKIAELPVLVEQIDFASLKALEGKGPEAQAAALVHYLARHPQGANRAAVEKILAGLADALLAGLQKQAKTCDAANNWDGCIAACERFLGLFAAHVGRKGVEELKAKMEGQRDLAALNAAAAQAGNDLAAARKVYTDYLARHPASPLKAEIQARMDKLKDLIQARGQWETVQSFARNPQNDVVERHNRVQAFLRQGSSTAFSEEGNKLLAELETEKQKELQRRQQLAQQDRQQAAAQAAQARLEQERQKLKGMQDQVLKSAVATGRFSAGTDGVVIDTKTGKMWALLDSTEQTGRCMDYVSARNWVAALSTGGFSDWRLPTASELAGIYKDQPFFPGGSASWYWSSESYVKGYHSVVNIVTTRAETTFRIEQERADTCGTVRAVRP